MQTIKRFKNKVSAILLTIAIALSFVFGTLGFLARPAAHADDDTVEYAPTALGISNEHFSNSSGSYPANPSSWTASALDGGKGSVVAGVVDLSSAYFGTDTGNKEYHLDQYPEYADDKDKPQTIFGASTQYTGSDEKALLINTKKNAEVAYAYSSSDMSFAANSFYRVSAWVKTGDFAQDTGATIKLTGLNQNCAFLNINTVKDLPKTNGIPTLNEKNKYGWVKYTFYVRTSAAYTRSVNLVLGIGDCYNGDDEDPTNVVPRPASGYAFFDTVSAERISAHDFATETLSFTATDVENIYSYSGVNGKAIAIDLYEPTSFTVEDGEDEIEIGTFSDKENFEKYWQTNVPYNEYDNDNVSTGVAYSHIYNSESIIPDLESDDNIHGFTQNPWAPLGRAEHSSVIGDTTHPMFDGTNANILLIKNPSNAAYGVASPTVTIERYKYYRFSVWIKGDKLNGSAGIGILVKGKPNGANNFRKLGEYSGLTGDSSDTAHYGWKQHVVYIKGSMLYDYTVKFELWLGTPSAKASGIAMFDNVSFDELTYSQYSQMSSADSGNVLSSIDPTLVDTGISNGNFNSVGDFENDEITFPMPVADWSFITPATAETTGFSHASVNTDNAVHGILPTDPDKFDEISASGAIPMVTNPGYMAADITSALVISSTTPTAIGYRSSAITVTSGSAYKITADVAVNNVTDGNGAMLILKTTSGDVISTIQNIKNTHNAYHTYTFYVNAPLSGQTLYLEIWLGHDHRTGNKENLSDGSVYVKRAGVEEWTAADGSTIDAEYSALLASYKTAIANDATRNNLDYGVYSFGAPTIDYYDVYAYAENDGFGVPYQWSVSRSNTAVKSGIINADDPRNIEVAGLDTTGITGNILFIHNLEANRTTYTYDNTVTFAANTYYRLDIDVRVDVADEYLKDGNKAVGAVLSLTGSNTAEFSNIKDTSTLIANGSAVSEESRDRTTFKTYSFYIAAGESGGDIGLSITFGGTDSASRIQGKLFVKNFSLTEIDNLTFEDAENDTDNEYVRAVTLSTADEDDDLDDGTVEDDENAEAPSSDIQWWIIPTIIFSAALLAVVAIIFVVKIREYLQKKRKKKITYSTEYDRSRTMRDLEKLQAQSDSDADADKSVPKLDTINDELDDDYDAPAAESATEETTEQPSEEAEDAAKPDADEEAPVATESDAKDEPAAPKTSSDDLDD